MIIKINYIEHYNGGLTINKVLKVKIEKIKPKFSYIKNFPFVQTYRKINSLTKDLIKGVQYVYLYNTDADYRFFTEGGENHNIYKMLRKISESYVRDFKIDEILK